jgi:hypothetical protein
VESITGDLVPGDCRLRRKSARAYGVQDFLTGIESGTHHVIARDLAKLVAPVTDKRASRLHHATTAGGGGDIRCQNEMNDSVGR